MTEERCAEHSRWIKELSSQQARQEQAVIDVKENHNELKDAFWKVEERLTNQITKTADKAVKSQNKIAVINTTLFILLGISQLVAAKVLIGYLK